MFRGIHHVAFIVGGINDDLDDEMERFEQQFGATLSYRVTIERDAVDIAVYNFGQQIFELMTPLDDWGWPYEHHRENGEGFFHIAFEVDNIQEAMAELERRGVRMKVDEPNDGVAWKVATMREEDTIVPMQIVEDPRTDRSQYPVE
jgi:methylmalonyl-CoA/ethylmalonyl-CoA epimerase